MTIPRNVFGQLAGIILEGGARQVTGFFSEREVVKATRRFRFRANDRHREIIFSIGRPNYAERRFIKGVLKQDKKPFPFIQYFKYPNKGAKK